MAVIQICDSEYLTTRMVPRHVGTYVGLYGRDGAVLGVLGVLFLGRPHDNSFLIGLVKSTALAIETKMDSERSQVELGVLREKNERVLNNSLLPILYLGPRGEIEQLNEMVAQLVGRPAERLVTSCRI